MTYRDLLHDFRITEDWTYDPWGSALGVLFSVADELHIRGAVPAHWEYRAGVADPREEGSYWAEIVLNESTETLITFGNILNRYTDMLRLAGRDY